MSKDCTRRKKISIHCILIEDARRTKDAKAYLPTLWGFRIRRILKLGTQLGAWVYTSWLRCNGTQTKRIHIGNWRSSSLVGSQLFCDSRQLLPLYKNAFPTHGFPHYIYDYRNEYTALSWQYQGAPAKSKDLRKVTAKGVSVLAKSIENFLILG